MEEFYKLSNLTGYRLNADDGEIGKLEEVLFDDQCWIVRYFIINTGSWLPQRKVLVSPEMIIGVNEEEETLNFLFNREKIENCPPVDTKLPVSRHYEQEYYKHYGKTPYWDGKILESLEDDAPVGRKLKKPKNPHLRSSDVVKTYSIRASDGEIGQVDDFILRKEGWEISFMEINTGTWLPGKHVLIAPTWIRKIDLVQDEVTIDVDRHAIETAPSYNPLKIITQEYQTALYKHYGKWYEEE